MKPFLLTIPLFFAGCAITQTALQTGIQSGYEAFIPAQIAILPCQELTSGVNYLDKSLTNTYKDIPFLCKHLDKNVLDAFTAQAYMRGVPPNVIKKMLAENKQTDLLSELKTHWIPFEQNKKQPKSLIEIYRTNIQDKLKWSEWLKTLVYNTHFCDAVLIPFINFSQEKDDTQGTTITNDSISLSIILIVIFITN